MGASYNVEVLARYKGRLPSLNMLPASGNTLGDLSVVGETAWLWLCPIGGSAPTWIASQFKEAKCAAQSRRALAHPVFKPVSLPEFAQLLDHLGSAPGSREVRTAIAPGSASNTLLERRIFRSPCMVPIVDVA